MPYLMLPERWSRQPPQYARLDFNHAAWTPTPQRFPGYEYRPSAMIFNAAAGIRSLWPSLESNPNSFGPTFLSAYKTSLIGTPHGLGLSFATTGACLNVDYLMTYGDCSVLAAFTYKSARESYPRIFAGGGCSAYGVEGTNDIAFTNSIGTVLTASGVLTPGKAHVLAYSAKWSVTGTPVNAFLDGRSITPAGTNGQAVGLASQQTAFGNYGNDGGRTWDGAFALAVIIYGTVWNPGLLQSLSVNPWQIFRPDPARVYFFPTGGAANYSVSLAESLAAGDSVSAQVGWLAALAESAAAADSNSSAATLPASLTESASAADTLTGIATYLRSVAESAAASDAPSAVMTLPASLSESAAGADATSSSVGGYSVTLAETAAAADSLSALLNAGAALAETAATSDSVSNVATLVAALAESVSATDSHSSTLNSNNYSVSIAEAASAVESLSAAWQAAVSVTEAGSAGDTVSAQVAFARALAEAAAALDVVSAGGILGVSVTETAAATDLVSAPTGFGDVPPERVIAIEFADRTVRIAKSRRPIKVLN